MSSAVWALPTVIALCAVVVFATLGGLHVSRLVRRQTMPLSDEVQGIPTVLAKLKKREPMTDEELALARQATSDRGAFMALCIPATIFSIGCFYVFGSLWYLHGATPSERTFLGVIPMFTSTNLFIRMSLSASLRRRLKTAPRVEPVSDERPPTAWRST